MKSTHRSWSDSNMLIWIWISSFYASLLLWCRSFYFQHIKTKIGCFLMAKIQKTNYTIPVHVLFPQTSLFLFSLVLTVIFFLHSFSFSFIVRYSHYVLPVVSSESLCFQIVQFAPTQTPLLLFIFSSPNCWKEPDNLMPFVLFQTGFSLNCC